MRFDTYTERAREAVLGTGLGFPHGRAAPQGSSLTKRAVQPAGWRSVSEEAKWCEALGSRPAPRACRLVEHPEPRATTNSSATTAEILKCLISASLYT